MGQICTKTKIKQNIQIGTMLICKICKRVYIFMGKNRIACQSCLRAFKSQKYHF